MDYHRYAIVLINISVVIFVSYLNMEKLEEEKGEDCIICLELLNKPVRCQTCQKYLCQVHLPSLNKCPHCRAEPFVTRFD